MLKNNLSSPHFNRGYSLKHFITSIEYFARANPGRKAITFQNRQWTYSELWKITEAIVDQIPAIKPRERIGVFADADGIIVAALAAIFLKDLVYLPLSPEFPPAYLEKIIIDSNPAVVIASVEQPIPELLQAIPILQIDTVKTLCRNSASVLSLTDHPFILEDYSQRPAALIYIRVQPVLQRVFCFLIKILITL